MNRPFVRRFLKMLPFGIAAIALVAFIGGQGVKLLWNALLPPLFGLPAVTYWQALGLLALCRILFGGLGGHRGWRRRSSEEEREHLRLRLRLHDRGGHDRSVDAPPPQ